MIFRDIFEPDQIHELVAQSIPVIKQDLNHALGIADYMWFACDGHRIQVERKQMDEILSDMDSVEELLGRELSNGIEETILLYEGDCEPIPGVKSATQSWRLAKSGKIMVPSRRYNVSYTGLQAWLYQLDKAGVTIVHTSHYMATAMTLVAMYKSSQETVHTTLRRYIKEHIRVPSKNPHVLTLMGIKGANLGEAKATALIERYGTVWYMLGQDAVDLAETLVGEEGHQKRLGRATVDKLFKAVGRTR